MGGSDKICGIVHARSSWKIAIQVRRNYAIQCVAWHPNGKSLAIGAGSQVAILDRDTWMVRHEVTISSSSSSLSSSENALANGGASSSLNGGYSSDATNASSTASGSPRRRQQQRYYHQRGNNHLQHQ